MAHHRRYQPRVCDDLPETVTIEVYKVRARLDRKGQRRRIGQKLREAYMIRMSAAAQAARAELLIA